MSKETEKIFKELHKRIDEKGGDLSKAQIDELIQQIIDEYNSDPYEPVTPSNAKTSDDFMELAAEEEDPVKAIRYAEKALQLDPDNLDAELFVLDIREDDGPRKIDALKKAIAHGDRVMEKLDLKGEDSIGSYWGILETRPYMRLRGRYLEELIDCGMYRAAMNEAREHLVLSDGDNIGSRYVLMHLYAFFEMEEEALELYEKYDRENGAMMLLPLAILYFKQGNWKTAEKYLQEIASSNKDLRRFLKLVKDGEAEELYRCCDDIGYRPYHISELATEFFDNNFLFRTCTGFFPWALSRVRKKK